MKKTFYVVVAIHVESNSQPITNEVIQEISSEMDYNFNFQNDAFRILDTEIKSVSLQLKSL